MIFSVSPLSRMTESRLVITGAEAFGPAPAAAAPSAEAATDGPAVATGGAVELAATTGPAMGGAAGAGALSAAPPGRAAEVSVAPP